MKRNFVVTVIRLAALAVLVYSLWKLAGIGYHYYQAQREYDKLQGSYKRQTSEETETKENGDKKNGPGGFTIAFDALMELNPDVAGWISFEDLSIDYPIVQGEDNDTYLHMTFLKNENVSGSIFMDMQNSRDFQDWHTVIYGHNMRDGSMFGKLKKYKEEEFYLEHPTFTIATPEHCWKYEIFSCHTINVRRTDLYTLWTRNSEKYGEFVNNLKEASLYDTGVEVGRTDRIITLSTCSSGNDLRFVVHAKRVEEIY